MKSEEYPVPDVPVDEAWAAMKLMLENASPATTSKTGKSVSGRTLLYAGAALLVATLAIFLFITKGVDKEVIVATHVSENVPLKDSLQDGTPLFLDTYTNVSETGAANDRKILLHNGGVYIQNISIDHKTVSLIQFSDVEVFPAHAVMYVSFDTALLVASVYVEAGTAVAKVNGDVIKLAAGEALQYDVKAKQLKPKEKMNANLFSYATLVFEFNDTPLDKAAAMLEKAYGVTIVLANKNINGCRITTRFDNKTLSEVLDLMAYTLNFDYTVDAKNKKVVITGNECD